MLFFVCGQEAVDLLDDGLEFLWIFRGLQLGAQVAPTRGSCSSRGFIARPCSYGRDYDSDRRIARTVSAALSMDSTDVQKRGLSWYFENMNFLRLSS
jgi:hypothetical protein